MYTPGIIANSQITPTKINKNGATIKVRIWWNKWYDKAFNKE